ncbi:MAG: hypothetical protein HC808_15095 [Candidatus Competibacteraceae bacterium]|nr:hypothetical protein [Candidatus Competibacteraceae bacterium]
MNVCRQDGLQSLRLFITAEHPCNYLSGHRARNLVVDPRAVNARVYTQLVQVRLPPQRQSAFIGPICTNCTACTCHCDVPVMSFHPSRSQNRTWKKNLDLAVRCLEPSFRLDHYRLFERYLKSRHPGGGMDDTSYEDYLAFITSAWSDTRAL